MFKYFLHTPRCPILNYWCNGNEFGFHSSWSGGVGISLVGVDTIIFYDSDWNSTMDHQVQDICHRIEHTHEVRIYRMVSKKTNEENIIKKTNRNVHFMNPCSTHAFPQLKLGMILRNHAYLKVYKCWWILPILKTPTIKWLVIFFKKYFNFQGFYIVYIIIWWFLGWKKFTPSKLGETGLQKMQNGESFLGEKHGKIAHCAKIRP